jgi:hypothetical protein
VVLDDEICILSLWAHVTVRPCSMTNKRQDAYALWARRGLHTLLVATNVGKNGTGDCARDTRSQRRGRNREGRKYR